MITVNIIPPPRKFLSRHDTQDRYVFSSLFCPALLFRRMMRIPLTAKKTLKRMSSAFASCQPFVIRIQAISMMNVSCPEYASPAATSR